MCAQCLHTAHSFYNLCAYTDTLQSLYTLCAMCKRTVQIVPILCTVFTHCTQCLQLCAECLHMCRVCRHCAGVTGVVGFFCVEMCAHMWALHTHVDTVQSCGCRVHFVDTGHDLYAISTHCLPVYVGALRAPSSAGWRTASLRTDGPILSAHGPVPPA